MKKVYSTPEISFENFELSTSIAANCAYNDTNLNDINYCGYSVAGRVIFVSGVAGCDYTEPDGEMGICYYVPTADNNVFNS